MIKIKLTVHKKEIDFIFGLGFMGEVLETLDLSIDEVVKKLERNPFLMVPTLMFISAKSAKEETGDEIDFTPKELINWIDESGGLGQDSVVTFLNTFTKSLVKDVPKEKETKSGSKKK